MSELDRKRRPGVYAKAQEAFSATPDYVRDDLEEALEWAKRTLSNHEGGGHNFSLIYEGGFMCCFCKPQWNADHCSQPMETAPEAIVMAVCEYLNGV